MILPAPPVDVCGSDREVVLWRHGWASGALAQGRRSFLNGALFGASLAVFAASVLFLVGVL